MSLLLWIQAIIILLINIKGTSSSIKKEKELIGKDLPIKKFKNIKLPPPTKFLQQTYINLQNAVKKNVFKTSWICESS